MKTFFFGHKNLAFAPFPPKTRRWPTDSRWQKGHRFPVCRWPLCFRERSARGIIAGNTASWWPPRRPWAVTHGQTHGRLSWISHHRWFWSLSLEKSPRNKAGCTAFENGSRKQNSCFSLLKGLWGDNTADGYFCSQKTSRIRVGHVFRQMCSFKALLNLHGSGACLNPICALNTPRA